MFENPNLPQFVLGVSWITNNKESPTHVNDFYLTLDSCENSFALDRLTKMHIFKKEMGTF